MIKRIEFTLNLNDPRDAEIYRALTPSLRYRRAGAVIRQALGKQLVPAETAHQPKSLFSFESKEKLHE